MLDCMIDLETLGQVPGCSILSIGAVMFDENGLGEEFYTLVNRRSCQVAGLHEDPATIKWWSQQPGKGVIVDAEVEETSIQKALFNLETFLATNSESIFKVRVWGNGADFDNAILAVAWKAAFAPMDSPLPWKFWNNRCYRTVKSMAPEIKIGRAEGEHHHALADAKNQALHLIEIWKKLNG